MAVYLHSTAASWNCLFHPKHYTELSSTLLFELMSLECHFTRQREILEDHNQAQQTLQPTTM